MSTEFQAWFDKQLMYAPSLAISGRPSVVVGQIQYPSMSRSVRCLAIWRVEPDQSAMKSVDSTIEAALFVLTVSKSKRHHYVSAGYQRYFADHTEWITLFDKQLRTLLAPRETPLRSPTAGSDLEVLQQPISSSVRRLLTTTISSPSFINMG